MSSPNIDLWIDGSGLECNAGWREPIDFNFDLFQEDRHYAALVSDHIQRSLANLAREVEEIQIQQSAMHLRGLLRDE